MDKIYTNYFSPKTVAERYLKGRPRYHSFVIEKIKKALLIKKPLSLVLDVGCGTGFSSVALRPIAEKVVGLDISVEMLGQAEKTGDVFYLAASAENLPLGKSKYDLITVSQAIHWIDKRKFFAEADRILKPESYIIAYDNFFLGKMIDDPNFNDWYKDDFLKTFPTPPRGERSFPAESENPQDFLLVKEEWHENEIELSARETADYLITMTNVINSVENGGQTIAEVESRISENIEIFFKDNKTKSFAFIAPIWYLQQKNQRSRKFK